jgi:hypothetical protein
MKNLKCKLGSHDWIYHNKITRQCLECGKVQYKKGCFWRNIVNSYFQRKAKVEINKDTETVTIKKGTIVIKPVDWIILKNHTRVFKLVAEEVEEDIVIYPSYEYQQKIRECEGTNDN